MGKGVFCYNQARQFSSLLKGLGNLSHSLSKPTSLPIPEGAWDRQARGKGSAKVGLPSP